MAMAFLAAMAFAQVPDLELVWASLGDGTQSEISVKAQSTISARSGAVVNPGPKNGVQLQLGPIKPDDPLPAERSKSDEDSISATDGTTSGFAYRKIDMRLGSFELRQLGMPPADKLAKAWANGLLSYTDQEIVLTAPADGQPPVQTPTNGKTKVTGQATQRLVAKPRFVGTGNPPACVHPWYECSMGCAGVQDGAWMISDSSALYNTDDQNMAFVSQEKWTGYLNGTALNRGDGGIQSVTLEVYLIQSDANGKWPADHATPEIIVDAHNLHGWHSPDAPLPLRYYTANGRGIYRGPNSQKNWAGKYCFGSARSLDLRFQAYGIMPMTWSARSLIDGSMTGGTAIESSLRSNVFPNLVPEYPTNVNSGGRGSQECNHNHIDNGNGTVKGGEVFMNFWSGLPDRDRYICTMPFSKPLWFPGITVTETDPPSGCSFGNPIGPWNYAATAGDGGSGGPLP